MAADASLFDHVYELVDTQAAPFSALPEVDLDGRPLPDERWREGIGFDPASWDGSDVFAPYPRLTLLLGERAKQALEAARLENVGFERLSEARYLAGDYS